MDSLSDDLFTTLLASLQATMTSPSTTIGI